MFTSLPGSLILTQSELPTIHLTRRIGRIKWQSTRPGNLRFLVTDLGLIDGYATGKSMVGMLFY